MLVRAVLLLSGAWTVSAWSQDVATALPLHFQYEEQPVKRQGRVPFRVTLVCEDSGKLTVTREDLIASEGGGDPSTTKVEGELSAEERQQVERALRNAAAFADGSQQNIGYSVASAPGWRGSLAFLRDGLDHRVSFTSLRPDSYPERTVEMNALVTLVLDLKNFALEKLRPASPQEPAPTDTALEPPASSPSQ
jgi:hypothetical protein